MSMPASFKPISEEKKLPKSFKPVEEKKNLLPKSIKEVGERLKEPLETYRQAGGLAISAIAPRAGLGGDVVQIISSLGKKAAQSLTGKELKDWEKYSKAIPLLGQLPTTQEVKQGIGKVTGGVFEPRTPGQEKAQEASELLSSLTQGKVSPKILKRAAIGTALGIGAKEASKEAGIGETGQEIAKSIAALTPLIASGKLLPSKKEAIDLYNAGKKLGFTEKELAPLLQSQSKIRFLGKFAKKGSALEKRFKDIKTKFDDVYADLKSQGRELPPLDLKQTTNFGNDLVKIFEDMPANVRNIIKEDLQDLFKKPITGEGLINFWHDIGAKPIWKEVANPKQRIGQFKEPLKKAFNEINPELAKDFENTQELYSRFAKSRKLLKPGTIDKWLDIGELGTLATGIATGNFALIAESVGTDMARRLTTQILINPRLQNLTNKLVRAMKEDNVKLASVILQNMRKEDPELKDLQIPSLSNQNNSNNKK